VEHFRWPSGFKEGHGHSANGALALLQDLQLAMSGNLGIQVNTLAKFVGWFAAPTSITKLFGYPVLSMAFINLYVKMKFLYTGSNLGTSRGRFRKRKKSYAKRALMPPRRGIGRTHGKRCLKVCNAASLSVFSDEQHGFFGVDFVMRNVQLEVLRIHQRSTTRNLQ
jgi:hypothetical protein